MPEKLLGIVYMVEAVLAILGFIMMPRILRRFGNFRVSIILLLLEIVSLSVLVAYHNLLAVSIFIVCSIVIMTFLSFSFDVFLEGNSSDSDTGKIRGIYMTCVNLAWALSPVITGFILTNGDYWKVYLAALILIVPVFLILRFTLSNFQDSEYKSSNPFSTLGEVWKNKNILNIISADFILQVFYSWMTIYTPIYLHTNLGLPWSSVGIIFGVMLLPFIFIQFPAGKIADRYIGEKEMLSMGFVIMALATLSIYFITGKSILVWAVILFATRVGAAIVEIMCDVYFFKKIGNENINLISFYRMSRPMAYIVGPLLASIILWIPNFSIKNLFIILAFIVLCGLKFSLSIEDTK